MSGSLTTARLTLAVAALAATLLLVWVTRPRVSAAPDGPPELSVPVPDAPPDRRGAAERATED